MGVMVQPPWLLLLFLILVVFIPFSYCQPQNIETFFPSQTSSPTLEPSPPPSSLTPSNSPPQQPSPQPQSSSDNDNKTIVKAVAATAASTIVIAALFFFVLQRFVIAKRKKTRVGASNSPSGIPPNEFSRFDGNLKGLIVDENGLDVLYWKKLEGQGKNQSNSFDKEVYYSPKNREEDGKRIIQEIPLFRGKSSTSYDKDEPEEIVHIQPSNPPPLPPSPPPPPPLMTSLAIQNENSLAPPPPPPPIPCKKSPAPPPPPSKAGGLATSLKPPPAPAPVPKGTSSDSKPGESSNGQVKLKPLHWDKVNTNADHSMVWDKIDKGSFRFDGDLMEALFGYVATSRKSPPRDRNSAIPGSPRSSPSAQIVILDARKSQNIAIVLKSLAISRTEIHDALTEGQGLNTDILEKLTKIAPTEEEKSQILEFNGDPTRLADAESFLYHLLKTIPSAFTRLNAMLFRSNYGSEILHLKESLQTFELGCKELRTRGLFIKLLEAILKAGNRMNAGTTRGNAQAFNLTSLRKLSDVRSSDGKTTLLHFVVQEVVRSEGKKCVINRNRSLSRNSSMSSNSSLSSDNSITKEEREKEYVKLGLPVVGGLSSEFSNVKKAAAIDCDTFAVTCSALTSSTAEFRKLVSQCAADRRGGGFVMEIKGFLEAAEEELKVVREDQTRVMELVRKTTEYYQVGASKDKGAHQLQLFVIVKDFLSMVDQVCVEIARNMQRRKTPMTTLRSSSPKSPASRTPVKFPNLPAHFMIDKSRSTSSESDTDS